jgi:hypothetical protein
MSACVVEQFSGMSQRLEAAIQMSQSAMSAAQAVAGTVNQLAQHPQPIVETHLPSPSPQPVVKASPVGTQSVTKSSPVAGLVSLECTCNCEELRSDLERLHQEVKEAFSHLHATNAAIPAFDDKLTQLSSGFQTAQSRCQQASAKCACSFRCFQGS